MVFQKLGIALIFLSFFILSKTFFTLPLALISSIGGKNYHMFSLVGDYHKSEKVNIKAGYFFFWRLLLRLYLEPLLRRPRCFFG
jgi:hypothetical protein